MTLLVDAVLALVLVEVTALLAFHRVTGRGIGPRRLLPNMAAGFLLMLAVRFALSGASIAVLACLAGALAAHAADLKVRWQHRDRPTL